MDLKIKICGMTEAANMREIAALKPDFFGLIFYPPSPRFVSLAQVKKLPQFDNIERVGVFVDETIENILTIIETANLAFVQLHGDESPEFCAELQSRTSRVSGDGKVSPAAKVKIIKAFSVGENMPLLTRELSPYQNVCDYFLFDTKTSTRGGSGQAFDWQILRQNAINKPFFLAGGIGAANAAESVRAIAALPLFALDINSRAEISPGLKSPAMIEEIIKNL